MGAVILGWFCIFDIEIFYGLNFTNKSIIPKSAIMNPTKVSRNKLPAIRPLEDLFQTRLSNFIIIKVKKMLITKSNI